MRKGDRIWFTDGLIEREATVLKRNGSTIFVQFTDGNGAMAHRWLRRDAVRLAPASALSV